MSQQGGRPARSEDDWWGQLYDDSTDDTGPTVAPDSLDDRFASAKRTVTDRPTARYDGEAPGEAGPPRDPVPGGRSGDGGERSGDGGVERGGVAGGAAGAGGTEPRESAVPAQRAADASAVPPPVPPTSPPPAPRTATDTPPRQRRPWEPSPATPPAPSAFPPAPASARPEPADRQTSTAPARPTPSTPAPPAPPASDRPAPPASDRPAPARPAPAPLPGPQAPRSPGVPPDTQDPQSPAVPPDAQAPSVAESPTAASADGAAQDPRSPAAPPGPHDPSAFLSPSVPSAPCASSTPSDPSAPSTPSNSAAPSTPSADGAPQDPGSSLGAPDPQDLPALPLPEPAPDSAAPPLLAPPPPPSAIDYVGSGPPTYDPEPTALPAADPDGLGELVADTVLDGARYGACTLRAVSLRGDSARYRGEPRRDSLLTARFGTGEQGLVLVALATGVRGAPGAHLAAAEACRWIGRAVGRSHHRLVEDLRASRRGDLKAGLHRLTDRSLGRLRASAAEQGVDPDEYTASLRCLLLPADPDCRTRVFFGVGDGGLFRLRDGAWQDIEPQVSTADTVGGAVVGFGSPPAKTFAETPQGDRLTMDLGIPTPPSPYEPAPEPPREPFRFRASVARPGDALVMCSAGLADPLRGEAALCAYLARRWSGRTAPGLAAFLADAQVRVKGYADDRTAAAVWEA
ncbi:protein phosphatase 2C domain-containing protein [Streptomyces sp. NPDC048191]|uniref:protein phosphatase 2C domain-containing protein n=1 Tax=Streptomyces sp. NPDC048191 TaxID=3155484 RepID=UPI0033F00361